MRRVKMGLWPFMLALWAAMVPAAADERPGRAVVVELFTSQGCASCPPAEALVAELALRQDVLPLALHVDYWDYIGWADVFAQPAFTLRQRTYAHAAGQRMVYTPQMIIGGRIDVPGTKPGKVRAAIAAELDSAPLVQIDILAKSDGGVRIRLVPLEALDRTADVIVVRYASPRNIEITRGENAGNTFHYVNVVTDWTVIGTWDTGRAAEFDVPARPAPGRDAVLVQSSGQGPFLAAARLD